MITNHYFSIDIDQLRAILEASLGVSLPERFNRREGDYYGTNEARWGIDYDGPVPKLKINWTAPTQFGELK